MTANDFTSWLANTYATKEYKKRDKMGVSGREYNGVRRSVYPMVLGGDERLQYRCWNFAMVLKDLCQYHTQPGGRRVPVGSTVLPRRAEVHIRQSLHQRLPSVLLLQTEKREKE